MENKNSQKNFTKDDFEKFMNDNEEKMQQLLSTKNEQAIVDGLKEILKQSKK